LVYRVRFVKPDEHYKRLETELEAALMGCVRRGDYIMREQLRDFEQHLAEFVGVKYATGLNSGYHALALSLLAIGCGPAHEVITVGHTFVATVSAIVHSGATPVLIDAGPDQNMDVSQLEAAITPRTKCILPVHLNGRLCDMDAIMRIAAKYNILVVEDAAQALGARYGGRMAGSFGAAGCFSFYPFKTLGGFGDGGAITTNDPRIARAAALMRFNGEDRETGEYHYHGYTALLDNIQAAVLDVKLPHLPEWIEHRRAIAGLYRAGLEGVGDLRLPHFPGDKYYDGFQNYVIRSQHRNKLRSHLTHAGVETLISWPKPMWRHMALRLGEQALPETEALCREVLSLPLSAETTPEEVHLVTGAIREFFSRSE
jgi:dTDP-4-amino-4,6-dideoxygalactose transaminase